MIRFEVNEFPFALTNDQMVRLYIIIAANGWDLDYDVVQGDSPARPHVKVWVHHTVGNPARHWLGADGIVGLVEDVDWDWSDKGVGTPTPSETDKE